MMNANKEHPAPTCSRDIESFVLLEQLSVSPELQVSFVVHPFMALQKTGDQVAGFCAYQRAKDENTKVVEVDSPFDRFLKRADGDHDLARKRLSKYWEIRQALFGDRALLPMNQCGGGALCFGDIEVLRSGFVAVLPNNKDGTPIVSFELSRVQEDFDDLRTVSRNVLRCIFYMYSIVSENSSALKTGVITLITLCGGFRGVNEEGRELIQSVLEIVDEALPLRRLRTDLVFRPPRNGKRHFIEKIVPDTVKLARDCIKKKSDLVVQVAVSTEKIAEKMAQNKYGYTIKGLPRILGGTWGHHEQFSQWRRDRVVTEKYTLHLHGFITADQEENAACGGAKAAADLVKREDEKREKRKIDAMYARRKRLKKKIEEEVLRERVKVLLDENESLRDTNQQLELLFARAQDIGARQPSDSFRESSDPAMKEPNPFSTYNLSMDCSERSKITSSSLQQNKTGMASYESAQMAAHTQRLGQPDDNELAQRDHISLSALAQICAAAEQSAVPQQSAAIGNRNDNPINAGDVAALSGALLQVQPQVGHDDFNKSESRMLNNHDREESNSLAIAISNSTNSSMQSLMSVSDQNAPILTAVNANHNHIYGPNVNLTRADGTNVTNVSPSSFLSFEAQEGLSQIPPAQHFGHGQTQSQLLLQQALQVQRDQLLQSLLPAAPYQTTPGLSPQQILILAILSQNQRE